MKPVYLPVELIWSLHGEVYTAPWLFFKGMKCSNLDNLSTTTNIPMNLSFVLGSSNIKYMDISSHSFFGGGYGLICPNILFNILPFWYT